MTVPTKVVVDCSTGFVSEIPLTDEEMTQREVDSAAAAIEAAEREAAEVAKADAKTSAMAKLATLGLTADEIATMLQ